MIETAYICKINVILSQKIGAGLQLPLYDVLEHVILHWIFKIIIDNRQQCKYLI